MDAAARVGGVLSPKDIYEKHRPVDTCYVNMSIVVAQGDDARSSEASQHVVWCVQCSTTILGGGATTVGLSTQQVDAAPLIMLGPHFC